MKSFRDRNPYTVGLASVLVIGALVGLAFMVGLLRLLEHTYSMSGVFKDAAGLRAGDEVRVAGVKAGRVTGIKPDRRHGNVIVTWEVNDGVDLGPGTTAEIALETLLGAKYVRLAGPVKKPFIADKPEQQRRVPIDRTSIPFDVFELTRIGTRSIQATDTEKLNTFIKQLADITADKNTQVRDLVVGIDQVATAVNEREDRLRELLDRADRVSATLADKDETLVDLIDSSQAILDLVVARRDQISRALGEGSQAVQELSRLIDANKGLISAILDTLHQTVSVVDKHPKEIDATLAIAGPGFLQQAQSGTHGPWQDVLVKTLGPDAAALLEEAIGSAEKGAP
jgi:phospholipid/cholesterol/gamma-HCH transport system substrate-binding protein